MDRPAQPNPQAVEWHFTTGKVRVKLKRLYPSLQK